MKKHILLLSIFTLLLWQVTAQAQIITTVAGAELLVLAMVSGRGGFANYKLASLCEARVR